MGVEGAGGGWADREELAEEWEGKSWQGRQMAEKERGKERGHRAWRYWEILNQNKGQSAEWKRTGKSQHLPINDVQKAAFFHKF